MMSGAVREVMTRIVVSAPVGATFTELVRLMHDHRVSAVPVVDDDGVVLGVVSESDLLLRRDPEVVEWHLLEGSHRRADRRKALARLAGDLMTAPAVTIGPDATATEAAHRMHEAHVKRLPVVDEAGHAVGIVSRADLLRAFLRGDEILTEEVEAFVTQVLPDPAAVRVAVRDGIVRLEGMVEVRTAARRLADRIRLLDGVVAVDLDRLDWEFDDTIPPVSSVPWVGS
jgi:CBS domain-containing protein